MPSPTLRTVLGVRQAEIMQYLWTHGSVTVREYLNTLATDDRPCYAALLAVFIEMRKKGLVEARRVMRDEAATRTKQAYVYVAAVTEATLLRRALPKPPPIEHPFRPQSERESIERLLAYLGTLRDAAGQPIEDQALDTVIALLERSEAAEQTLMTYQAEVMRAWHRVDTAQQQANSTPAGRKWTPPGTVYEYPGKVCRVCGRPAMPAPYRRIDTLRVCALEKCREEARRRDNVAKQRRAVARRQEKRAAGE
jgi:predicted transcriptional regulator